MSSTITITYGENVENHIGNQQIGQHIKSGLSADRLKQIRDVLVNKKYDCEYIKLNDMLTTNINVPEAGLLIVRNFVDTFFNQNISNTMHNTLKNLNWDKKALMKGTVKNKKARWNLCFANFDQEPDYANGKGRIYDFNKLPQLLQIKKFIESLVNIEMNAEGNYYYDSSCYIGYHGDAERKIVVAVRFGDQFPISFKWFKNNKNVTEAKITGS